MGIDPQVHPVLDLVVFDDLGAGLDQVVARLLVLALVVELLLRALEVVLELGLGLLDLGRVEDGGRGQYGHVWLKIEPNELGKGYEFVNGIVGGTVPREFIPAVDKGIKEAVDTGVIAGYPVVDVKVTLFDGSYHDVDSNEMAFKIAGSMGFKDGFRNAKPVILEPIMKVEVVTPEDHSGDVIGDLNRRRGQITGMDDSPSGKQINPEVPLSQMFGYATTVRSMSQGRATFTMEFSKYMEVPPNVAQSIIKQ